MSKYRSVFFGYRIYRIKFIKIVCFVFLISAIVFSGVLVFLMNTWMSDLRQQSQDVFAERERRLDNIRLRAFDYTNGMYEDAKLIEDTAALFDARSEEEYTELRRVNSLKSNTQIGYLPANIMKKLLDRQNQITGVTLDSDSGTKALWWEYGNIRLKYELEEPEAFLAKYGYGDIMVAACPIRNPEHMEQTLGRLNFWVNSQDIYGEKTVPAQWAITNKEGTVLLDKGMTGTYGQWLHKLRQEERQSGWLFAKSGMPVFFVKQISEENGYCFFVMKDIGSTLYDNRYTVSVMVAAFVLVALGVLACYYAGIQSDAAFMALIMDMLSSMEHGDFNRMQELTLPVRHRQNEYLIIAETLKDVGMKLKGYIETEYILKLKEQESQMRALQHQINPHFLYNSLEMLQSKALINGDREMADAIFMLGSLYRGRVRKADSITLKEEFASLEMYLKIMLLRFGDSFVYQMELEDEIGEIPTVNFWMQPLAENFFAHGFHQESDYNLLIVSGCAKENGAEILISDNGSGAEPSRLKDIRRNMMEGNDEAEGDIGLRNVYMRLNYFYGSRFRMDVDNNAEGGFRISIFLPEGDGASAPERMRDVHTDDSG